jgi:VPDSG-CTERM motif
MNGLTNSFFQWHTICLLFNRPTSSAKEVTQTFLPLTDPGNMLFFLDSNAATMNVPAGFTTGFSFFYSAINNPGFVNVYDGLNGTGNILTTLNLPVTASDGGDPNGQFSPFVPFGVNFSGTALSVDFGGTANQIGFDDVTLGSSTPGNVPDGGATLSLLGLAMSGLVMIKRKFRS